MLLLLAYFQPFPNIFEDVKTGKHKEIVKTNQISINKGDWIIKLLYIRITKHTDIKKRVLYLYVLIQKGVLDILIIEKSKWQTNIYGMTISVKIYTWTYTIIKIYKML